MNLETKITIYKFTPQLFTLTLENLPFNVQTTCFFLDITGNLRINLNY